MGKFLLYLKFRRMFNISCGRFSINQECSCSCKDVGRWLVKVVVLALMNCFDTHKDTGLGSWVQVATL